MKVGQGKNVKKKLEVEGKARRREKEEKQRRDTKKQQEI